ncbi:MAG: hypothetical protein ABIT01_00865 [Thermoanaerobaculia bacterium]
MNVDRPFTTDTTVVTRIALPSVKSGGRPRDEVGVRAEVERRALRLVEAGPERQKSDERLPLAGVELKDEVFLGPVTYQLRSIRS